MKIKKKLVFFTEARFIKNENGDYYNAEGSLNLKLWNRYLKYFDTITIVARVKKEDKFVGNSHNIASGSNISFVDLPYYVGPKDYFFKKKQIKDTIAKVIEKNVVYLMRVPGTIGSLASKELVKRGVPYGVEVVGDPVDVFSKGSINHPLRVFFKHFGYKQLKQIVENSSAALYVTLEKLQQRYPVRNNVFTTSASNVILRNEDIVAHSKELINKNEYNLLSIGSLAQMYKAPDVVLKSLKQLKDKGYNCKLTWLGAGHFLDDMKKLAVDLDIVNWVNFAGYVSDRKELSEYLDKSDIFLLVSRTEGLPRVIIEAMARGLPVIGSKVGGIPELVQSNLLVEKDDVNALTEKIIYLLNNADATNQVAIENLKKSHQFSEDNLNKNRAEFYQKLINISIHE